MTETTEIADEGPGNFIKEMVATELKEGRRTSVQTRFPPEPNGYLHIGHAKAIVVNFGLAAAFDGRCNLRFDDTNPAAESVEYVEAIKRDVSWLGFEWGEEHYTSDYFEQLYLWARQLIEAGRAYVDSQSAEEVRESRGDFHRPGIDSPYRARSVEENLDLFARMRAGEFDDGAHLLRAKIDMTSKDVKLRDPVMYRIKKVTHHRTGDEWPIYPIYDWAHGQSDAIEGITHSLCSLEFQNHRPLYNWFLSALELPSPPEQTEFGRLNLSYTVLSKRKLLALVEGGQVQGWDDPRMPTLAGMRRRGYTAKAIVNFCERIGVSKRDGVVDVGLLEHALREDLNEFTERRMAVLDPLKIVLENYPKGEQEWIDCRLHPVDESFGSRKLPFSRELYVERSDFMEEPFKKWHRLAPGKEVRLRYAALVTCKEVIKDENGKVIELRCHWDPESKKGAASDGRKVRGTLHWVNASTAVDAEVRVYDRLFSVDNPLGQDGKDYLEFLNTDSCVTLQGCKLEPELAEIPAGKQVQFERLGYFVQDAKESRSGAPVFNRVISLKDSWAKLAKMAKMAKNTKKR